MGGTRADLRHDREKGFVLLLATSGRKSSRSARRAAAKSLAADEDDEGDVDLSSEDASDEELTAAAAAAPFGWQAERSKAGVAFVSPSGQRCLSAPEAHEVARRSAQVLAPTQNQTGDLMSTSASGKRVGSGGGETRVSAAAAQMVEVVHGTAQPAWLVDLLKGMLFGAGEGTKAKKVRRFVHLQKCYKSSCGCARHIWF